MARLAGKRRRRAAGVLPPRPHERARRAGEIPPGPGTAGGLNMAAALYESNIKSLPLVARGKVRDMYAVGTDRLLIVTTDRLSAFDVVLPDPIPDKGEVLNQMSNFWFGKLAHIVHNHLNGTAPETVVKGAEEVAQVRGRAVVVRKLKPLPIEAVV